MSKILQGGAPTIYKWGYNLYEWPYKWVTGGISPQKCGVMTQLTAGRGPPCGFGQFEWNHKMWIPIPRLGMIHGRYIFFQDII